MIYSVLLFAHLLAVFVSFGAAAVDFVAIHKTRAARSAAEVLEFSWLFEPLEKLHRAGGPLILLSGIGMLYIRWNWNQAWLDVSLVTLVLIAVSGGALNAPKGRALHAAAVQANSAMTPALAAAIADPMPLYITSAITGAALGVTWLMVSRPGLLVSIATIVIGIALGLLSARTRAAR